MPATVEEAIYKLSLIGTEQLNQGAAAVDKLAAAEGRLEAANDRVSVSQ